LCFESARCAGTRVARTVGWFEATVTGDDTEFTEAVITQQASFDEVLWGLRTARCWPGHWGSGLRIHFVGSNNAAEVGAYTGVAVATETE
jgi:hypothetical protein